MIYYVEERSDKDQYQTKGNYYKIVAHYQGKVNTLVSKDIVADFMTRDMAYKLCDHLNNQNRNNILSEPSDSHYKKEITDLKEQISKIVTLYAKAFQAEYLDFYSAFDHEIFYLMQNNTALQQIFFSTLKTKQTIKGEPV